MSTTPAAIAVDLIVADLTDRRGLRHEWENIDDDTIVEIKTAWIAAVQAAYSAASPSPAPSSPSPDLIERTKKVAADLSHDIIRPHAAETVLMAAAALSRLRAELDEAIKAHKRSTLEAVRRIEALGREKRRVETQRDIAEADNKVLRVQLQSATELLRSFEPLTEQGSPVRKFLSDAALGGQHG